MRTLAISPECGKLVSEPCPACYGECETASGEQCPECGGLGVVPAAPWWAPVDAEAVAAGR